jgi:hypothetical protein
MGEWQIFQSARIYLNAFRLPLASEWESSAPMPWLTDPQIWISLVTLTVLEIVLGIDNIIFISILAGQTSEGKAGPRADHRAPARTRHSRIAPWIDLLAHPADE